MVVVREGNESFLGSCRYYCLFRLDPVVFFFALHCSEDAFFRVVARDCGVGTDLYFVSKGCDLVKKDVCYLVTAGPCIFVFASKKFVGLLDQLAARVKVALYYRYFSSRSRCLCRRTKPCRSAAYYEEVCLYRFLHMFRLPLFRFQWDLALAMLGLHFHACRQRRYAGTHVGHSVDYHEARTAFAYRAEKASRTFHLRGYPVDPHIVGMKRHRYRLALKTLHILAVKCERYFLAVMELKYRVFLYQFHALSPSLCLFAESHRDFFGLVISKICCIKVCFDDSIKKLSA
ncbi:hypothetical protein SDC9_142436 [bioreactor metagenome]|uniref:Uncharacterized protein n=1 Tax=bioreactor metagenome TaxID=1076179 RepID=A0A645E3Y7_9ZZZZ